MVEIDRVGKRFSLARRWGELFRGRKEGDRAVVLDEIRLQVGDGEFFAVLGRNGAGKSTLFRILAGLLLPDEGEVRIAGRRLDPGSRWARRIVAPVIPNERSLYWRISARENLRLYGALHELSGSALSGRIEEVLEVVGLQDTGKKQVGLFSSGMKQRLLIARALLSRPRVLLLDEPTRSLDPISAREFRRFLREEIGERQRCTVLLATHDREEVRDLCSRVGVLHRGRLLAVGAVDEILGLLEAQEIRIRVREALPESLLRLGREAGGRWDEEEPAATGWHWRRLHLPGMDEPEWLLEALGRTGVRASRIERVELSLAELIEGVESFHLGSTVSEGRE